MEHDSAARSTHQLASTIQIASDVYHTGQQQQPSDCIHLTSLVPLSPSSSHKGGNGGVWQQRFQLASQIVPQ